MGIGLGGGRQNNNGIMTMYENKTLPTVASKAPLRILISLQTKTWLVDNGIEEVPFHGVIIRDGDKKVVTSDVEKASRKHSDAKKAEDGLTFVK